MKIKKNENVIICDNEYGSNHIALLNNKIKIRLAKTDSSGQIVISNLLKIINGNTRVVFLCHIASQNGNIMFVEKIGEILKKNFLKSYLLLMLVNLLDRFQWM